MTVGGMMTRMTGSTSSRTEREGKQEVVNKILIISQDKIISIKQR